jgi:peptide/nickel transport system substrate-binding protein
MRRLDYQKHFLIIPILILLVISFLSCSKSIGYNSTESVFRYNESSGIVSLDPAFAKDLPHIWACNQLFNGLVSLDENLGIVPSIAKNWKISDDGKTYIFNLRNDVYFHENQIFNGDKRKVVAQDFVFSFDRLLQSDLSSPGTWIFNSVAQNEGKADFVALNDTMLQIRLKEQNPSFLGILSMVYASVVPHEAVEKFGNDFRRNPVGTGPFMYTYWKEGVKLILKKNINYFEKTIHQDVPIIDGVAISFLVDRQTAFLQFVKGKFDFMSGIDARYKDELLSREGKLRQKYQDQMYLQRKPFLNTEYLGIYIDSIAGKQNPMRNLQLRKAINYAIDREKMLKFLRNGIGKPGTGGMIPYGMPGHDSSGKSGYSYQPLLATQIVKESGLSDISVTLTTTAEYVDIAKFVQSQLSSIGLQAFVEVSQPAALRQARALGKLSMFRSSWVADYPDAENYLTLFTTANFAPNGPNYTHYSNPKFDQLYTELQVITSPELRSKMLWRMDSLLMESAPVVVLFYDESLRFVNKRISGLGANAVNNLDLRKVRISD